MKIINAYWEKRNLGVECVELNADNSDTLVELSDTLSQFQAEYQIVRIPAGRTDMLLSVQAMGFQVIEVNIQLSRITNNYTLPTIYKRFEPFINIVEADQSLIDQVLAEIKKGEFFITDKVALDPFFSPEKSGHRYYNWSKDILGKGGHLYVAQYKGENIGFALNYLEDGNVYNAFIGGVFPKYANKGLGFLPLHANVMAIISQGGAKVKTGVSVNNIPILKLHLVFGFDVLDISYILIKH